MSWTGDYYPFKFVTYRHFIMSFVSKIPEGFNGTYKNVSDFFFIVVGLRNGLVDKAATDV